MIQFTLFVLQLILFSSGQMIFPPSEEFENGLCNAHTGGPGKCVPISSCPSLIRIYSAESLPRVCSWLGFIPIVCCPDEVTISPTPGQVTVSVTSASTKEIEVTDERSEKRIKCGMRQNQVSAIEGGSETETFDWPWMAALLTRSQEGSSGYNHFCGGTIISESVILTAAHCVNQFMGSKVSELYVGIGSNILEKTIKFPVERIIIHPNFDSSVVYHDISLLMLSTPIKFNETMIPICLPDPLMDVQSSSNSIRVAGWGRTSFGGLSSDTLLEASVGIMPNQRCNESYSSLRSSAIPDGIRGDQLCAGSPDGDKDSCQGDSGGPLAMQSDQDIHYQIGIISFGRVCANQEYPGVYTRVSDYVPWIKEQLQS